MQTVQMKEMKESKEMTDRNEGILSRSVNMNARKIRKLKCMIVAVLAVAAFAVPMAFGAFSDTWDVPWFDNGDGNPYTDSYDNVWAVHQV